MLWLFCFRVQFINFVQSTVKVDIIQLNCAHVFYFILFYFILFYFILFYFILFYFILFYFIPLCNKRMSTTELWAMTNFMGNVDQFEF